MSTKWVLALFLLVRVWADLSREVSLDYVTALKYVFDYRELMKYPYKDCRLQIQAKKQQADNQTTVYNRTCEEMFHHSQCLNGSVVVDCPQMSTYKRIEIWNYQMTEVKLKITISQSDFNLPYDLLDIMIIAELHEIPQKLQTILLTKEQASDYILPFNLLSQKAPIKIIVEEPIEAIPNITYTEQRFIETYWNQYGKDQILLSWLPYFSQCEDYQTNQRLMLNDLICPYHVHQPGSQYNTNTVKFTEQGSYFTSDIKYDDKNINLICLSEQISGTVKKLQWYENTLSSHYYFFRNRITREQYKDYIESSTLLAEINHQYYDKLIPLEYQPDYDQSTETPNSFVLQLFVKGIEEFIQDDSAQTEGQTTEEYEIVRAVMTAHYKQSTEIHEQVVRLQGTSLVGLQINVVYLSPFEFLDIFMNSPLSYIAILLGLSIVLVLVLNLLTRVINRRLRVDFWMLTKLLFFPALKGYLFALLCNVFLILYFYYLASATQFSAIGTTFDGKLLSSEDKELIYTGRLGLTILMAGYFLLSIAINQSFKVLSLQEAKIILEDAQEQDSISRNFGDDRKSRTHNDYSDLPTKEEPEQVINEEERRSFIIKNMSSHRKYLSLFIFAFVMWMVSLREFLARKEPSLVIVYLLIGYPVAQKIIVIIYRYYIVQEMLYLYNILICYQAFSDFFMLFNVNFGSFLLISLAKIFVSHPLTLGLEVLCDYLAVKCQNYMLDCESRNKITCKYRFLTFFNHNIKETTSQSKYQKTLYYTGLITVPIFAAFARVFIFIIYALSLSYNHLCKNYQYSRNQFYSKGAAVSFAFLPLQIYILLTILKFFNYRVGLPAIKLLQFQHFKFMHRKINWINDCFIHNRCVIFFYREFEKFCQSSQMYILSFMLVFSLNVMVIGLKIILQARYTAYSDPALLVIISFVWLSINCFSMVINFIAIKFKFYGRKQEFKMRARLENVEKILRISDYSEYLQVEAIKNYFLLHCRQWIVENLTKILQPRDFTENNFCILSKYKHYKCLLRKQQIQKQRREAKEHEQVLTITKKVHEIHQNPAEGAHSHKDWMHLVNINNSSQLHKNTFRESNDPPRNDLRKSYLLEARRAHGEEDCIILKNPQPNLQEENAQENRKKIIKLPHKVFESMVKPLVYSWLSTAKQFVFLKRLIRHIKQQKTKEICQFCSMNIELEALEKHDFAEIVNQYRLLNVGRPFIQHHFVSYYRFRQEYATVCVECKERKLHVDHRSIEMSGIHAAILKKWIITARGRILHRQFNQKSNNPSMLKDHQD